MAQYSYGLIIIYTKQENIVYGVNTLFIDNVVPGDIFMVDDDHETPYVIKEVVSNTKLILSTPYIGRLVNLRIQYSISRDFSMVFNIPVVSDDSKSFSTISTLSLRMFDSIFKNLGFINPLDPVCISGNGGIRVFIIPKEAVLSGGRWRIVGTDTWRKSAYVESGLEPGLYTLEFKDGTDTENRYIVPVSTIVRVEKKHITIVIIKFILIGAPATVEERLILFCNEILSGSKKTCPAFVTVSIKDGTGIVSPLSRVTPYMVTVTFDVYGSIVFKSTTLANFCTIDHGSYTFDGKTITVTSPEEDCIVSINREKSFQRIEGKNNLSVPVMINVLKKTQIIVKPTGVEKNALNVPEIISPQKKQCIHVNNGNVDNGCLGIPQILSGSKKTGIIIIT